jgi:erythromycin esterase
MKRFVFICLALAVSSLFQGNDRIAYLKKHAVPVRSIDAEDSDYADLEPLRGLIGNRRVVMLGEPSHGDGAVFAAKTRLIKFLHERMGFDVLALEGGFYDVRRVWSALKAGEDPLPTIRSGVFVDWADSLQVQPLWRYVVERIKSSRPLELAGFDLQFTGSASRDHLVKDLNDYLAKAGLFPEAAPLAARVSDPLNWLMDNLIPFHEISPGDRPSIREAMDKLGQALGQAPPLSGPDAAERAYWIQLLKSSATMMELAWKLDLGSLGKKPVDMSITNLRDRQMGENFVWLAKQALPTRKIVVWAAASHIARNRGSILSEPDPMISMGDWIDKAMGSEVYALGFTAYEGRWRTFEMSEPRDVEAAAKNSLEDLLFKAGFKFAWLDFRNLAADGVWLREPLSSRPLGHNPKTADWTRIMDGMFFVRETFPSTRIETK